MVMLEERVTTIGFGQLNAFIFFLTRFLQMEPIYCWVDLWTAFMFLFRTAFFFRMFWDSKTGKKRNDYFLCVKITFVGLLISALGTVILNWIEWGATFAAFPWWPFLAWVAWGVIQFFTWRTIRSFCESVETAPKQPVEQQDNSINDNSAGANQMQ